MTERVFLSLRKAVIKRPGMYFGDEGAERLQQLIDELVSNAVDQYLRGQCRRLDVRLDDDGAIAIPIADPSRVSFAIVEPPYEPAALAAAVETDDEAP